MKLLRWTVAGATAATALVVYKYSIGKKAKGKDVLASPEKTLAELEEASEPEVVEAPKSRQPKAAK